MSKSEKMDRATAIENLRADCEAMVDRLARDGNVEELSRVRGFLMAGPGNQGQSTFTRPGPRPPEPGEPTSVKS